MPLSSATPRQSVDMDLGWKFITGDAAGSEAPLFHDSSWTSVNLPPDWGIAAIVDTKNPTGSGGGYFPAGIGWYRKTFAAPTAWRNKRISIKFGGVYMNATVYLNGHNLGVHPNGYTSFAFDLSPYLTIGKKNLLAVRVDNLQHRIIAGKADREFTVMCEWW